MKRALWKRAGLILCCALWALFIWSNSMQNGEQSAHASEAVAGRARAVLENVTGLSLDVGLIHAPIRKLGHLAEYAALGCLLWISFGRRVKSGATRWLFPLLIGFLTAALDESIQYFVPGRSAQVSDVLLDAAGVLLGLAVSWGAGKAVLSFRRKK